MSDRSNKPSFAVSRNLQHTKYHFIEAITDKLTESSNTTPNSVSTSTWLCVTSNTVFLNSESADSIESAEGSG